MAAVCFEAPLRLRDERRVTCEIGMKFDAERFRISLPPLSHVVGTSMYRCHVTSRRAAAGQHLVDPPQQAKRREGLLNPFGVCRDSPVLHDTQRFVEGVPIHAFAVHGLPIGPRLASPGYQGHC
jgi:hypothetical protein